jgi:hypothetical protein
VDSSTRARITKAYGELPLSFEANRGQADPQVGFVARGAGYNLLLNGHGATMVLPKPNQNGVPSGRQSGETSGMNRTAVSLVRLSFVNANHQVRARGLDQLSGKSNHIIGGVRKNWHLGVPSFARVQYRNIYPGVDVVYHGQGRLLEYDFVLAPGADPNEIRIAFEGTSKLALDADGQLLLAVGDLEVKQHRPVVYQEFAGAKKEITARYVIKSDGTVGFEIGAYDPDQPLIIDPVLAYSTYLGGTFGDQVNDIAVDSAGNAYVTGSTFATNFPITPGAFQTSTVGIGGNFAQTDVFVTKFNAAGNAVIYSTYLGGTDSTDQSLFFVQPARGNDVGRGIAVDSQGRAYITGTTTSNNDYPVTPNAIQSAIAPNATSTEDIFVTELNAAGDGLIYSTRLGGTGADNAFAIALDGGGSAYVTGSTESANFPTTPGAFRPGATGTNVFVSKLNTTGTGLIYSTLIGVGIAADIAVDAQGNAFVTGQALNAAFPTTPGAFQTTAPDGGSFINAFVTKVNATGDSLVYSTYLGGRLNDFGNGLAIDPDGNAYVVGSSDSNNFPTTPGAIGTTGPGTFVTKLNAAGTGLVYSTMIGTNIPGVVIGPVIREIALNTSREAYLIGSTGSNLPTTPDAFQTSYGGGGTDAFVMKINSTGTAIIYATYLGGTNADDGTCIAVDSSGSAYVGGLTQSSNFPVSTGAFQAVPGASPADIDSFVAKFADTPASTFRISGRITGNNANGLSGVPVMLSGSLTGLQWTLANGNFLFGNLPAGGSYTVTPLTNRFNFAPINRAFDNLNSDQTSDFIGTAQNLVFFSPSTYRVNESNLRVPITVNRTGDTAAPATVDYITSDGSASERKDYNTAIGTLRFAPGETSKTFDILLTDDNFAEANETILLTLNNPTGGIDVGTPNKAVITIISNDAGSSFNPVDSTSFFVRQHYVDFLNRLPDSAGQSFWNNQIDSCGSNAQCIEVRRIDVSASFFLSIEFQQTGYLVERIYKSAFGDAQGPSTFGSNHQLNVPIVRFSEFIKDTQRIGQGVVVLQPGWEQALENNKQAYTLEFVQSARFITALPATMAPAQFVDTLNQNAGMVLSASERATAINLFSGAAETSNVTARAQALRQVAEDTDLYNAEYNRAFVLAEYFGYLRRNPNDTPDSDYTGYDFWLTKLNQFNGNYINAEMVKAFLSSIEYRQRFGP